MNWLENFKLTLEEPHGMTIKLDDGTIHHGVRFVQLFPLRMPQSFISVIATDKNGKHESEIGIIRQLDQVEPQARKLILNELQRSFFLPEIQALRKLDITGGIDELIVITDRGEKTLFICDRKQSIHTTDDGMLLITDMDKCRYRITNPNSLSPESRHLLEKIMP